MNLGRRILGGLACLIAFTCARPPDREHIPAYLRAAPPTFVDVFCTVVSDLERHGYVYEYSFLNRAQSRGVVELVGLRQTGPHDSVEAPRGWVPMEGDFHGAPRALMWASIGEDKRLADDLDFMRFPTTTAVYPGEMSGRFSLRSIEMPETTGLVAEPFVSTVVESEDDEPGPFAHIPSVWQTSLIGTVYAPRYTASGSTVPPAGSSRPSSPMRASFIIAKRSHVRIEVIDGSGSAVAVLMDRTLDRGSGVAAWNGMAARGHAAQPGTYFARMIVDGMSLGRHTIEIQR